MNGNDWVEIAAYIVTTDHHHVPGHGEAVEEEENAGDEHLLHFMGTSSSEFGVWIELALPFQPIHTS